MAKREWTAAQRQCLAARGTVLVSAAAGSGKTAVLVERVIRLLTDPENPVNVDELLVVTFTKAAAAEMKQRLTEALTRALSERPDDRRLQRQLMLLPGASISTVDSFCKNLIRENFHRLPDVSPQFKVSDSGQVDALRAEALDEVLEEAYALHDPAFLQLAETLGGEKNDRKLIERVENLYDFLQASPDPDRWMTAHAAPYHDILPLCDTLYGRELIRGVSELLHWYARQCKYLIRLAEQDGTTAAYVPVLRAEQEEMRRLADSGDWDDWWRTLQKPTFARLPMVKNCTDPQLKDRIQELRNKMKDQLKHKLPELLCCDETTAALETAAMAPVVDALFSLVRAFSTRFAEKKRQRNLLDFNDLEHFALALLTLPDDGGELRRTPLAKELAAHYTYVMVDEYQDTNQTQDRLFRAISQEERNLFFVGDVKQSIYAFRNATPDLFIERRDRYPAFDGATYPAVIRLGNNFRSRRCVTETVNFLFRQLMTRETCGVEYDEQEELVYASSYTERPDDATEWWIVDTPSGLSPQDKDTAEARVIAHRIRELLATDTVTDKAGERPLHWGDICILLRSTTGHASVYADELNRMGIPAVSNAGSGFFEAPEIAVTRSLLHFLGNPLLDVPLLSVMMSPLFAFTPDDLALLRADRRHEALFVSVRRRARVGDALGERCHAFLQNTDRLRTVAATLPADRLLSRLYDELAIPAVMGVCSHGDQRRANLQQLLDMARQFEQNGYRGLPAFVRYLDRRSEQDETAAPAPVTGGQDAVRILSIHGSKGLEFPVVFLAGLGREFNNKSEIGDLLLHREMGVGLNFFDSEALLRGTMPQKQALKLRIRRDARAEDLRILYVAVTRARERLCLVMTTELESSLAHAAAGLDNETLAADAVLRAGGYGDWLLMTLLRHPDAGFLRSLAEREDLTPLPCDAHLVIHAVPLPAEETAAEETTATVPPDEVYSAQLTENVAYAYPYAALGTVPVKMAVSDLAHREFRDRYVATSRPAFFSETELSPAERGTALHQFMQFADYTAAAADVTAEIRRLMRGGFLTRLQGECLPVNRLRTFFESELYRRIQASPQVRREYAFTTERPAAFCMPSLPPETAAGEQILIQGIADCVFMENGQLVIVDYKTDHVSAAQELADRYRPQLRLYAEALAAEWDCPVSQCLLYSFSLQQVVPV